MPIYTVFGDIYNVLSEKVVGQLTDDTTQGVTVNTGYVDSALERAEGTVESYVGTVLSVPLATPVSNAILHAILTLASCNLHLRRPGALPDELESACQRTIKWLEDVRDGVIVVDPTLTLEASAGQANDPEIFVKQIFG